jgi:hypothetical protein
MIQNGAATRDMRIVAAAVLVINVSGIACSDNAPHVHVWEYATGRTGSDFQWWIDRVSKSTQNNLATPSSADPTHPMALMNYWNAAPVNGHQGAVGYFAWVNRVWTANERATWNQFALLEWPS